MSTYELLGWPTQVGILFLTIGLVLALVPYLGGADFGVLKVPDLGAEKAKVLKRVGPVIPIIASILFLPVWPKKASIPIIESNPTSTISFEKRMKFDTGWIFVGIFSKERQVYIEGPYAMVAFRPTGGERGNITPAIGDVLLMKDNRNVRIVHYRTDGLKYWETSPPLANRELQDDDLTGVILPKGSLAIVRECTSSSDPGRDPVIWCRVADCNENLDQCIKARSELSH